jgi:protein involved in polysaccharide export with SLBB domain
VFKTSSKGKGVFDEMTLLNKLLFFAIIIGSLLTGQTFAQEASNAKVRRNSPFSPNPKKKVESLEQKSQPEELKSTSDTEKSVNPALSNKGANAENAQPENEASPNTENTQFQKTEFESHSVAKKTLEVAKRASTNAASLTEIYKVGVGDVLFISLQNAPAKESTYFTVLKDGTIDYPLAGEMVSVTGLTIDEIETALREKIKLYENPQISVKVREHNSHVFTVLGMVEKAGEKFLQREAIPLYVVRAEAIVQSKANRAVIKRANAQIESIDLKDKKYEDVLVFPGDIVEFDSVENSSAGQPQFYYTGGNVRSGGQKDFYRGITLTQAILASGGLKKSNVKNVIIRRKSEAGLLVPTNYDLKAIKEGKAADPQLEAGDTIEIEN